jgi:hypothetical protein
MKQSQCSSVNVINTGRIKEVLSLKIRIIFVLIVLMVAGCAAAADTATAIASPEDNVVKILGLDASAFPKIQVNIFIDKFCAIAGNLKKDNFKINEEGKDAGIDNFCFTGNASGQKLDLAVVFDDSGSMDQEISTMKSKIDDLTDKIKASGLDANYALISFRDSVSVRTKWTEDPAIFKKNVDSLSANGGGDEPEVSLDAIETVLSMGFRPDAQKVILIITDAHAHYQNDTSRFSNYTQEEIKKDLKESGVIFILLSPARFEKSSTGVDLRDIAKDLYGVWIDINSADFSTILEHFEGIITGTYVIEYTSPNQAASGNRTVTVIVNAPGCIVGSASNYYNKPGGTTESFNPQIRVIFPDTVP